MALDNFLLLQHQLTIFSMCLTSNYFSLANGGIFGFTIACALVAYFVRRCSGSSFPPIKKADFVDIYMDFLHSYGVQYLQVHGIFYELLTSIG